MTVIVCKFGGTSMATAKSILRVRDIVLSDARRSVCVVSAPGLYDQEPKLTDSLLECRLDQVYHRVAMMMIELTMCSHDFKYLDEQFTVRAQSSHLATRLSFGEHMSAYMLSRVLRWTLIDAVEVIRFTDSEVNVLLPPLDKPFVVPGFYGYDEVRKKVKLFPRGGSDISASYIAAGYQAHCYENWTDVSGVYAHDPRVVSGQQPFQQITYDQLALLAKNGAQVFHPEAILPVVAKGIPTVIRNTFAPEEAGTIVVPSSY